MTDTIDNLTPSIEYYDRHAEDFFNKYQSLGFSELHNFWYNRLNTTPGRALDIGTGSGRDAVALGQRGWDIDAVDPSTNLLEIAARRSPVSNINWFTDSLPELRYVEGQYDLILVSAVWQHLSEADQKSSIARLSELVADNGAIVITLRSGPFYDSRESFPINLEDLKQWSRNNLLDFENLGHESDKQLRQDVSWSTLILRPR